MKRASFWIFTAIAAIIINVFAGCASSLTYRYNTLIPMEESCIVSDPEDSVYSVVQKINNKYVDVITEVLNEDTDIIIPAGLSFVKGFQARAILTGITNVWIDRYGKEISRSPRTAGYYTLQYTGVFNLEAGAKYEFCCSEGGTIKYLKPTDDKNIYIDDEGNLYPLSICYIYYMEPNRTYYENTIPEVKKDHIPNDKYDYFIFPLEIKKIDNKLEKTYFVPEYASYTRIGLLNPPTLGLQFGNNYGFAFFSNALNVHLNAEWGLGIGLGFAQYDFSDFKSFMNNMGFSIPINIGFMIDFDFYKWSILSLGGGYLLNLLPPQGIFGTPYVQAVIARLIYIDYYFTPCNVLSTDNPDLNINSELPLYHNFGIGIKSRF